MKNIDEKTIKDLIKKEKDFFDLLKHLAICKTTRIRQEKNKNNGGIEWKLISGLLFIETFLDGWLDKHKNYKEFVIKTREEDEK